MLKLRQLQKEKQKQKVSESDGLSNKPLNTASYSSSSPSQLRIDKDLMHLELPPCATIDTQRLKSDNIIRLSISPDEGYYKGGRFSFSISFKDTYPMEPPIVKCLNTIYHPNIDYNGSICLNVLREDWSPVMDLQTVVIGLLFLFLEPNGNDPLNKHAAETLIKDEQRFQMNVTSSMMGRTVNGQVCDFVLH
ncbi:HHL167Cp [Eremothecium sinecaudum]|uniref:NEDD8-conjugating enzyme UBC12 n=1 Tax=Eremothecium sinecaudum TaxID=45286 RepID=A0A109V0I4_9SACH|nr:HHL167Cp [Eremothecium sinecaudum]AMD22603.1 HHL167Cp [Eremothecium sinecaudum]